MGWGEQSYNPSAVHRAIGKDFFRELRNGIKEKRDRH